MQPEFDFGTFLLYLFSFFIAVFMIRWIFRIDRILDRLDKQYEVTKLMADKMGVDGLDIMKIDDFEAYKKEKRKREEEEE